MYVPSPLPQTKEPVLLINWVYQELNRVSAALQKSKYLELAISHAAPEKTRDGLVVIADGSDWDPGSGEGVYVFYNSTWNYLG
jgi:hypothetical protein